MMTKRRRILSTLGCIVLATYITGPQAKACSAFCGSDVDKRCVRVRLTTPAVQLFYADNHGTVEGFRGSGQCGGEPVIRWTP
jgi:hypothetical protein